jgi:hypothetical protein
MVIIYSHIFVHRLLMEHFAGLERSTLGIAEAMEASVSSALPPFRHSPFKGALSRLGKIGRESPPNGLAFSRRAGRQHR